MLTTEAAIDPYSGAATSKIQANWERGLGREYRLRDRLFPLAIVGLYHMNLGEEEECGYAEATNYMVDRLVYQDYIPTLTTYLNNPSGKFLGEASGYTWKFLAKKHPFVIDLARELFKQEIFFPVLGTYTNPLPVTTRPDVYRHQVVEAQAILAEIFGDLGKPWDTFYGQEFFYKQSMMTIFDEFKIRNFIAWADHVAMYLPKEEQEWYKAGGFIIPRVLLHSRGPTYLTPIQGDYIEKMRVFAHQFPDTAEPFVQFMESMVRFNVYGNGLYVFGPSDAEYNGFCTPLKCGRTIPPRWWQSLFNYVAQSEWVYFENPKNILNHTYGFDLINLGYGGSRDTTWVWTQSLWNQEIMDKCDEALTSLDQFRCLIAQIRDPEKKRAYNLIYLQAVDLYHKSLTSDALGYNPTDERKDAAYEHAEQCIGLCMHALST